LDLFPGIITSTNGLFTFTDTNLPCHEFYQLILLPLARAARSVAVVFCFVISTPKFFLLSLPQREREGRV